MAADDVDRAFTARVVREIAGRHGIPVDQAADLQAWLRHAARKGIARDERQRRRIAAAGEVKSRTSRRRRICRLAKALSAELGADPELRFSLSLEVESMARERSLPLPLPRPRSAGQRVGQIGSALDYLSSLLELIGVAAEDVEYEGQRGRPGNVGLNEFAKYIADYYEDRLGRRFTIDYHQGTGTTQAFDFLRDVAEPVFQVSEKQLVTAARRAVADRRSHTKDPVTD